LKSITTALSLGALLCASTAAFAGDTAKPMFKVLHPARHNLAVEAAGSVPAYTYTYTYQGTNYTDQFVGADPSTGASTTVPVYIIPVKLTYGTMTTDPLTPLANGKNVIQNTIASPLFSGKLNFVSGGVAGGKTQYIDAYARFNNANVVQNHKSYHVLLGNPTVTDEQSLVVPSADGKIATEFGVQVINAYINWFDTQALSLLTKLKIPTNAVALFATTQTYLTELPRGQLCCIGGYHSVSSAGNTYMHYTYIDGPGAFAQDVSALSHELGEWQLDPFTNNNSACGIMENGDPLENEANYGGYPYTVGGTTYNLQDLVYLPYFGAPTNTSVKGLFTFQGTPLSVCQNGS
jgi:hypothetical protein